MMTELNCPSTTSVLHIEHRATVVVLALTLALALAIDPCRVRAYAHSMNITQGRYVSGIF